MKWLWVWGAGVLLCLGLTGQNDHAFAAQSEDATYLGSQACLGCHSSPTASALGTVDASGWKETLHANIYRIPTVETVIGDFNSTPVEFAVGNATLTVSFDDGGAQAPGR